jgi:serine/threonine-protein kinase
MVMEYMEGRDLADEITARGALPFGVAAGMILEVLDAVAQAHAVGIVHRDLKPANLFLARRMDGSQRVKVLDFGISKTIGAGTQQELSLTKTSAWIGSPLYMAPEQMQSARDVDARADIWSLGAILYELVSGTPPYQAESLPQLCNLLITTDPEPVTQRVPGIPEGLAQAIMGCLVRDPNARTQTALELASQLAQYSTSITGSGMRQSLLARTEVQMSAPASTYARQAATGVGGSTGASGALVRPIPRDISESANVAWGATGSGPSASPAKKYGIGAALALTLLGAGWFAFRAGSVVSSTESVVAVPAAPTTPSAGATSPVAVEESKKVGQEIEPPVESPAPAATAAAAPPASAVPPAPRSVASPRPAPASRPKPGADLEDFGGRR